MNINELNEELNTIIETQIEGYDDVTAIKQGIYEKDNLAEVVLDNIDEFSVDELVAVLDNEDYYKFNNANELYPSGFAYLNRHLDYKYEYPAKLAEAVLKCKQNELNGMSDLYNIYYRCHGDLDTWGNAAKIWSKSVKEHIDEIAQELSSVDPDAQWVSQICNDLEDDYPEIVEELKKLM